jgi:hypothetical protein
VFCSVYAFIFAFGTFHIYRLLRVGPIANVASPPTAAVRTDRCLCTTSDLLEASVTNPPENSDDHVLGSGIGSKLAALGVAGRV